MHCTESITRDSIAEIPFWGELIHGLTEALFQRDELGQEVSTRIWVSFLLYTQDLCGGLTQDRSQQSLMLTSLNSFGNLAVVLGRIETAE